MAIDNQTLQNFFNKQKKPRITALITNKKISKNNTSKILSSKQDDTKVIPNQYQTDTKVIPNQYQTDTETSFLSLTGLQKKTLLTIYKLCQITFDKKTNAIPISQLSEQCESTVGAIKTVINRLITKKLLIRNSFKNGRGGWTVYSLPYKICQEIFNMELQYNQLQANPKAISKIVFNQFNSSSYIYNNTTTTKNLSMNNVSDEWLNVDVEPLSMIGFKKIHLAQIAAQNLLTVSMVQDSIYAFAFDLLENDKAKNITGDPINYFMGILCKGKPYVPTSNYESPKDKAIRLYKEKMVEIEQKRMITEKEITNLAFNNWFASITEDQKRQFLPEMLRKTTNLENSKILETSARQHFEKTIWPKKRKEITNAKV